MRRNTGREAQGITLAEAIGMMAIVIGLVALVVWSFLPRLCRGHMHPRSQCMSNLHVIGNGLSMYLADYGVLPMQPTNAQRLGVIRYLYVDSTDYFDCPFSEVRASYDPQRGVFLAWDYWLEGPIAQDADPMRALAGDYNADGMNQDDGSCILFVDMHVLFVSPDSSGRHPNKYLPSVDPDIYSGGTVPRHKDDADLN